MEIQRQHSPVFELARSMSEHMRIPVSFDGEADAFVTRPVENRLQVGSRLAVTGPEGLEVEAILESGVVMAQERQAWCSFLAPTGVRFFSRIALSEAEIQAYEQHPSTFFGVIDPTAGRKSLKAPIDYYNFFWESMNSTPKARLLDLMKDSPDVEELAALSQYDLAIHYCVRMAEVMIAAASADAAVDG